MLQSRLTDRLNNVYLPNNSFIVLEIAYNLTLAALCLDLVEIYELSYTCMKI